ncbi:glycerol-3-phosphate dehydrogenase [NAD+] [Umbelopsis sp. PMI_123]|nr:glycerol-3-phosphate dehydrogenase [NAD+] [Umbelopsis sp. PMI_123]
MSLHKVAIIGSGNWGSAIAKIVGENAQQHSDLFDRQIRMWVYQEKVDGRNITDIINEKHENTKYLPGVKLPENIVAIPDLVEACEGADLLVFVLPHQFVANVCKELNGKLGYKARAISLIKGLAFHESDISLFTDEIQNTLNVPTAALSGANIADEVAREMFCETTIGSQTIEEDGELWFKLFNTPYFRVSVIADSVSVQICGALKNVVAVGAGLCDGLKYGNNTKAAVIRRGLLEMRKFGKSFFGGVRTETFFESCGVADLITTCLGGRNRKVAEAFVHSGKSIEELERDMLNGQKLQGTTTAKELHEFLSARGMTDEFPLLTTVYRIIYGGDPPETIVRGI